MAKRYDVYGVGAALVDTEINVSDDDLVKMGVEKGLMTLVDKEREKYLFDCLAGNLVRSKRTSGGSTADAIIGIAQFGGRTFYSCKVGNDDNGNTGTCLVMITRWMLNGLSVFFLELMRIFQQTISIQKLLPLQNTFILKPIW